MDPTTEGGDVTTLSIRVPPSLAAVLDATATEAALSRSGWVRRELVRILPPIGRELPTLSSSPPRRPMTVPPVDLAAVSKLSADLSRTGGSVVQLAKAMRETGHPSHQDAEAVLSDLRQVQRQLSGLIAMMSVAVVPVL